MATRKKKPESEVEHAELAAPRAASMNASFNSGCSGLASGSIAWASSPERSNAASARA